MMSDEHELAAVDRRASLRSAGVVGAASLVGSTLPVVPFVARSLGVAIALSVAAGVTLLFVLGALKARWTSGAPARSGLALVVIGTASALAGYVVGAFFAGLSR